MIIAVMGQCKESSFAHSLKGDCNRRTCISRRLIFIFADLPPLLQCLLLFASRDSLILKSFEFTHMHTQMVATAVAESKTNNAEQMTNDGARTSDFGCVNIWTWKHTGLCQETTARPVDSHWLLFSALSLRVCMCLCHCRTKWAGTNSKCVTVTPSLRIFKLRSDSIA